MAENNISGIAFRDSLFDLFLKDEYTELFKYYLIDPCKSTKRTNLFLGVSGRQQTWGNGERKFSRFDKPDDERKKDRCLLIQLHKKLYPELYLHRDTKPALNNGLSLMKDDSFVYFENMKVDCTYLAENRIRANTATYPIAWSYDWLIEVENIFEEFAYTLRSLLDINCGKRMAIFFTDYIIESRSEAFLKEISARFYQAWQLFLSSKHTRQIAELDLCLYSLIFPETFNGDKGIAHYLKNTKLVKWDQKREAFVMEPQYNF